jgi:hypothetical protein
MPSQLRHQNFRLVTLVLVMEVEPLTPRLLVCLVMTMMTLVKRIEKIIIP